MKHTCEKCSMDATFLKADDTGLIHYYCDHHAAKDATRIGMVTAQSAGWKKFLPIIIIFASILLFTAIAVVIRGSWNTSFALRMMMGAFFLVFSLFKIFNLKAFAEAYATYDILAMRSRTYSVVYPFIELVLAILYFANIGGTPRDVFTFIIMIISSLGVIQKLKQKEEIPCACLGMVFKIPMTWVTLIEDVAMALEALAMILMAVFITK